jgi:hypothetical protein
MLAVPNTIETLSVLSAGGIRFNFILLSHSALPHIASGFRIAAFALTASKKISKKFQNVAKNS